MKLKLIFAQANGTTITVLSQDDDGYTGLKNTKFLLIRKEYCMTDSC